MNAAYIFTFYYIWWSHVTDLVLTLSQHALVDYVLLVVDARNSKALRCAAQPNKEGAGRLSLQSGLCSTGLDVTLKDHKKYETEKEGGKEVIVGI